MCVWLSSTSVAGLGGARVRRGGAVAVIMPASNIGIDDGVCLGVSRLETVPK